MVQPVDATDLAELLAAVDAALDAGRLTPQAVPNLKKWLTEPPYRAYYPKLAALIREERFDRLNDLFWQVIPFGTGGRRGPMDELGSATINERTIAESAHGLAVYLKSLGGKDQRRAVVACDTRHRSAEFARLTATTLAAHGFEVFLFDGFRATPELSFAVRHLGTDAGVMISASHNPPSDNGFKAYWSNGGQVLPPHDAGIIECVYQAEEIPTVAFDEAVKSGRIRLIGEEVDREYVKAVTELSLSGERGIRAVYTPLHGVGETSVLKVLHGAGFADVIPFEPQRAPDGNFPNVPNHLPNPELPAVFEPATQAARKTEMDLILASDPDADRLGVVARSTSGEYVRLTGNQVGALLTDYVLAKRRERGDLTAEHYIVETLVTTPLIAAIGRDFGVRVVDDLLVGFKYIAQTMDERGPERFVFGAEESLGYLAGDYARDKDAAIAALYVAELAAELKRTGRTVLDRLDELFVRYGYHTEGQRSEMAPGATGQQRIALLMQRFRSEPPAELGGVAFQRVRDYQQHEIRRLPENRRVDELSRPEGNLLIFESIPGDCEVRIAVRPSGTEPKIKFYFFARADVRSAADLSTVRHRTDGVLERVGQALSAWVREILAD